MCSRYDAASPRPHHAMNTIQGPRQRYADVVGGIITFVTMAYIAVVNPGILAAEGTGVPFAGVLTELGSVEDALPPFVTCS